MCFDLCQHSTSKSLESRKRLNNPLGAHSVSQIFLILSSHNSFRTPRITYDLKIHQPVPDVARISPKVSMVSIWVLRPHIYLSLPPLRAFCGGKDHSLWRTKSLLKRPEDDGRRKFQLCITADALFFCGRKYHLQLRRSYRKRSE